MRKTLPLDHNQHHMTTTTTQKHKDRSEITPFSLSLPSKLDTCTRQTHHSPQPSHAIRILAHTQIHPILGIVRQINFKITLISILKHTAHSQIHNLVETFSQTRIR